MDNKTQAFLTAMEAKLGYELTVVQGCYNAGAVSASAGTHDGGGVVDLGCAWDHQRKVRAARELGGFASFTPDLPAGVWASTSISALRDHGRLAPREPRRRWQASPSTATRPEGNGLAGNAVDRTWPPTDPSVTFHSPGGRRSRAAPSRPGSPAPATPSRRRSTTSARTAALLDDADADTHGRQEPDRRSPEAARAGDRGPGDPPKR